LHPPSSPRFLFFAGQCAVAQGKFHSHFPQQQGVNLIDFPPYSPDLNIIENVWAKLKQKVSKRNPTNLDELRVVVQEEWERINPLFIDKLIASMPNRLRIVKLGRGIRTRY
jgi:transposase